MIGVTTIAVIGVNDVDVSRSDFAAYGLPFGTCHCEIRAAGKVHDAGTPDRIGERDAV